ncbi:hypothetical protein niasHT_009462 [Heterodera trifolii]|uniref:Uncharacterized protein n=1 Tax=Heterodera trifolii TaxID=157864 RepID=A0ABD2MEI2_9BILA
MSRPSAGRSTAFPTVTRFTSLPRGQCSAESSFSHGIWGSDKTKSMPTCVIATHSSHPRKDSSQPEEKDEGKTDGRK